MSGEPRQSLCGKGEEWGWGLHHHPLCLGATMPCPSYPYDQTDAAGAKPLLAGVVQVFTRLALIWANWDNKRPFAEWVAAKLGWCVESVQHPDAGLRWVWVGPSQDLPPAGPTGFRVLPRRWVVERTFAWLGRNRELSKDDAALPASEKAWISAVSSLLLLRWSPR